MTTVSDFLVKWTPRGAAMLIGGYYGLGIAYEWGLLAMVDKVAIQVIKHFFGYAGIGALMPTVQWYSAWAVRIAIGLTAGLFYDISERCVKACHSLFARVKEKDPPPHAIRQGKACSSMV